VTVNFSAVIFIHPSGPLFYPADRPTGLCPNARMASPSLAEIREQNVAPNGLFSAKLVWMYLLGIPTIFLLTFILAPKFRKFAL